MSTYPRRGQFYAHRFIRLLTKTAAAQDLGGVVCWLLSVVVMQEDSKRYTEPAKWYLEQLAPLCGMSSKQSLITAINKAKEAGWLEYTPGGKGVPGRFWVTIPSTFEELPDSACDESIPNIGTETVCSPNIIPQPLRNLTGSLPEAYRKPCASIPTPTPSKKRPNFVPPVLDEVQSYCTARSNSINAEQFLDYYTANGWTQGKGKPIRDWQATVRTWERNGFQSQTKKKQDDEYQDLTQRKRA